MKNKKPEFDVIIIGGGPAGLSSALWCSELGLKALLLERESELGGQLLWTYNSIKNYLGVETKNGREMLEYFLRQFEDRNSLNLLHSEVFEIDVAGKKVSLKNGDEYCARALIVATGIRRRRLGVPGEAKLTGKGIIESGARERESVKNKRVLIVGGGDAALENALILSENTDKVFVAYRKDKLSGRQEFIVKAKNSSKIEFLSQSRIRKFIGGESLEAAEIEDLKTGVACPLPIEIALIRIGAEPNTELLVGQLELDDRGYVRTNNKCETSSPGVFAAGDVANRLAPTISGAVGTGATAAKAVFSWLNRSELI